MTTTRGHAQNLHKHYTARQVLTYFSASARALLSGSDSRSMLVVFHHSGSASMTISQYDAMIRLRFGVDSKIIFEGSTGGMGGVSAAVSAILLQRHGYWERGVMER